MIVGILRTCYLLLLETSPRCQMVMISDFCLKVPGSSPGVGTMAWVPNVDLEPMQLSSLFVGCHSSQFYSSSHLLLFVRLNSARLPSSARLQITFFQCPLFFAFVTYLALCNRVSITTTRREDNVRKSVPGCSHVSHEQPERCPLFLVRSSVR
jgi:hypothetical protein